MNGQGISHLVVVLVLSEEDVEGPSKAPHSQHQEQQGPLDVIQDRAQGIHKGVLGGLEHSAQPRLRLTGQGSRRTTANPRT